MKRKLLKTTTIVSALLACGTILSSCGGSSSKDNDPQTLNIVLYNAGWGREWLDDVATTRKENNPGFNVEITAMYDANQLISRSLSSKNNKYDLLITTDNTWRNYAAQGKFASLDDLMEETVDNIKFIDKVDGAFKDDLYFTTKTGEKHVYRLPWTSGMGGIYYNAKMFRDNGWKVPKTTTELSALIKTIQDAEIPTQNDETQPVTPIVFTGENTDYFDYAIFNWWYQLIGMDAAKNFLNYKDAEQFNYKDNSSAYSKLYEVVKYWNSIFSNPSSYLQGSLSYSNHLAQQAFFNGQSAMIFSGDWMYNEILGYGEGSNFELAYMTTPTFDSNGQQAVATDVAYAIGSDQYIAIPESSIKKDAAKSFIKTLISNDSLSNFTNKAHGFLAYKNTDESKIDRTNPYIDSYMNARSTLSKRTSDDSDAIIYLNGDIKNVWINHPLRPFLGALNGTTTIESAFDTIYATAKKTFSEYTPK